MATGGIEVDDRTTCSVCLELYRGRGAKILPCFHTFCLPCLAGLVKRTGDTSQTSDTPGLDTEGGEGGSADSLTCPTCRRVIPVPAGGVTAFQTNFYVDSSSREEDGQPIPCTLCDGDQTAQFHCGQCQNYFCSLCRRSHDKICRGSQVRSLQDPPNSSSSTAQSPTRFQVRQQLQQVKDALKKLTEEEKKLDQERRAMDDSINIRYATLLRLAADARDECYISLREVCDGLTERLHSSMAEAQQTQDTLQQQLLSSQPAPVSASQLRAARFLEGELRMILNRDLDSSSLLQHQEGNESMMVDTLKSFMGKVVGSNPSSGPAQSRATSGSSPCFQDSRGAVSLAEAANPRNLQDLYEKLEDVVGRVTSLQTSNTLLSNLNSKLLTEHSALQREVTTLKDKNVQLTTEQAGLQREVMAMRDKHAIVHQDLAVLTAEKDKVSAELAKLQKDVISMQTDTPSAMLQTDVHQLKDNHGDVTAKLSSVQADITALQGDNNKMKKDITAVQEDNNKMKKDSDQLKTDVTNTQGKLSHLESQFVTTNTQVGFSAWLSEDVTTNDEQTLVCDNIVSNEGGGYDAQSGEFTVPVTGTYCFLASTSLYHSYVEKAARLDIVVDGELKGYVYSEGSSWSTGHTVVKLTSGQKVWLRSRGGKEYMFGGDGWTHFSGMLLQAEV